MRSYALLGIDQAIAQSWVISLFEIMSGELGGGSSE
jgi:hypothetical protein